MTVKVGRHPASANHVFPLACRPSSGQAIILGELPLSDFIAMRLVELERHRGLFHELGNEGEVTLIVALYTKGNHAADVLYADALRQCAELGINIELDIYCEL